MKILVDSDILIEVSRGRDESLVERWNELAQSDTVIVCSPVTVAELWHGALPREYKLLTDLFGILFCVPVDREIGRIAGDFLRLYRTRHHLELGDAIIAATASVHDTPLWTRNRKHYPEKELEFF
jgi:predicted nucleic acid-binding protein